jgi:hypothetical protein
MEMTGIIASVGTFVLGIGVVWKVIGKFLPKAVKYALIARDAIDLVGDILDSLQDGKLDQAEIDHIKVQAEKLKADLKS